METFLSYTSILYEYIFPKLCVCVCLYFRIHDRKISVLGFCAVMQCQLRPEAVLKIAKEIVPAMLVQLDGLKDSYQSNDSTTLYTPH